MGLADMGRLNGTIANAEELDVARAPGVLRRKAGRPLVEDWKDEIARAEATEAVSDLTLKVSKVKANSRPCGQKISA